MATTDFVVKNGLVVTENAVIQDITDSSSIDTGALVVEGGVGIEKNLYVGSDIVLSGGDINSTTALLISSDTTNAITLDSGTTGAVNIGTNGNAKTITIGNGNGTTSVVLNAGTGAINIGTNTIARAINIGNITGASALTLEAGTGAINVGTGAVAKTITIGNITGATALTLNSGTGAINIGTSIAKTITIGNTTGATALTLNSGTGAMTIDSVTGAINVGTSANAKAITIGNGTGATSITMNSGSGAINVGTNAVAKTITVGNTTGATGIVLNSGTAGVTANMRATGIYKIQATQSPTTDMVQITNTGQGNITAGVNALAVTYVGGSAAVEASAMRIDLTPGATTGGTWSGLRLTQGATTATGVTVNVLKADTITAGAGTDNVLWVGTGYDSILNYNGSSIINGTATTITGSSTLTLNSVTSSAITLDSGTTGAVNIGTNANAKTITIGNTTGATALALKSGTGNIVLTATTGSVQLIATGANIITATTNGTERMRIDSSGRVGIAASAPTTDLQIGAAGGGDRTLQMFSAGATRGVLSTEGTNGVFSIGATNDSTTGILTFKTGAALTEKMRIDKDGNVGIGTAAPNSGSNAGVVSISTSQNFGLSIFRNSTNPAQMAFLDANNSAAIGTNGSNSLVFFNASRTTERMRIDSSGRVGIGTTAPNATLEVFKSSEGEYLRVGGGDSAARSLIFTSSTGGSSNGALHTINAASVEGIIALATASTERMRIDASGQVGIGKTNPATALDVTGTVTATAFSGPLTGNASTATKLQTTRAIQVSGAVTGTANFDGSAAINIVTTATSDPVLTLAGDATGSATFTNLGNATLTVAIVDDSHNHTGSSGNFTVGGDLTVSGGQVTNVAVSTRDKYRVWNDGTYVIGMQTGFTFGGLTNDYAMTFQMSDTNGRGFWWGDVTHTNAQGAMSLTTQGKLSVAHSIRLGYGETDTTVPGTSYVLDVNGSFAATTKSFVIDHPTKEGMKLRHGSLEGPEDGVYVRGRLKDNNVIELPDYWTGLVHEDSITVNLTAIGRGQDIWVEDIVDNKVIVGGENVNCFYTVFATRKDVEKFAVEYEVV